MTNAPSRPRRSRVTGRKRVKEAKRRLEEELWTEIRANEAYERYRAKGVDRRGGRLGPNTVPKPYTPPATPQGQINTTDLDSRMVKGQHGWLQGYNAQAAINEHRIVIAAEIAVVSPDFGHLAPMVAAARRELEVAGITDAPKVVARGLGLLAHRADAPARRRRHPGPDPARIRTAQDPATGLETAATSPSCATSFRPSMAPASTSNANT